MSYVNAPATTLVATRCAICARELVDVDSVECGVGPTCRENYPLGGEGLDTLPDWEAYHAAVALLPPGTVIGSPEHQQAAGAKAVAQRLLHAIAAKVAPRGAVEAIEALGYARLASRLRLVWRIPSTKSGSPGYVTIRVEGARVVCDVEGGKIPGNGFQGYLAACRKAGLRFTDNGTRKAWEGATAQLPSLCRYLLESEVPTSLDDLARAELEAEQDAKEAAISGVHKRISAAPRPLYPYQAEGAVWLAGRIGAILADEMGLGKSGQAIAAAPDGGIVIVSPSSVMGAWLAEFPQIRPGYKIRLSDRKKFAWPGAGEAVIVASDSLPKPGFDLPGPVTLIVDEAHKFKNSKAERTLNLRTMSDAVRAAGGHVWALTGTPIKRSPADLWTLLVTVGCAREVFPGGWGEFAPLAGGREVTQRTRNGNIRVWDWKPENVSPELAERIKPAVLRRSKEDKLPGLPAKVYINHDVELDEPKNLTALLQDPLVELGILTGAMSEEKLRNHTFSNDDAEKLAGAMSFETLSLVSEALGRAKIKAAHAFADELAESGERAVLFAVHRCVLDTFADRQGWCVITGDTPRDIRTWQVAEFQKGTYHGIAVSLGAGSEGITLTAARNAVFVEKSPAPDQNAQAEDRIHRIGQTGTAVIHNLRSSHPYEALIERVLAKKHDFIKKMVDTTIVGTAPEGEKRVGEEAFGKAKRRIAPILPEDPDAMSEVESRYAAQAAKDSPIEKETPAEPQIVVDSVVERKQHVSVSDTTETKGIEIMSNTNSTEAPAKNGKKSKGANAPAASTGVEKQPSLPGTEGATDGEVSGGRKRRFQTIPIALLSDNPKNARQRYEGIEELATTLANGMIEPISVVGPGADGNYTIVAGHRRKRAASLAGWTDAPCQILGETLESDALTENGPTRRDLLPWEVAAECYRLRWGGMKHDEEGAAKAGISIKEIAKRTGFFEGHTKNMERMKRCLIPEAWAIYTGEGGSGNVGAGAGFDWAVTVAGLKPEEQKIAVLKRVGGQEETPPEEGAEGGGETQAPPDREAGPKMLRRPKLQDYLDHAIWLKKILAKEASGKNLTPDEEAVCKKATTKIGLEEVEATIKTLKWVLGDTVKVPFVLPEIPVQKEEELPSPRRIGTIRLAPLA